MVLPAMKKPIFTTIERQMFQLLCYGRSYAEIGMHLSMTIANVHTRAAGIRLKTGLKDLLDAEACKLWQRNWKAQPDVAGPAYPTKNQLYAMQFLAEGSSLVHIATLMEICLQTVHNHLSQGCKRAGITEVHGPARVRAITEWVAKQHPVHRYGKPPLSPVPPLIDPISSPEEITMDDPAFN